MKTAQGLGVFKDGGLGPFLLAACPFIGLAFDTTSVPLNTG